MRHWQPDHRVAAGKDLAMAVARSMREGWLTSLTIDKLGSDAAELFLFRLALKADKNGVYHAEPELLRSAVYPLQISRRRLADVTRNRDLCAAAGLLRLWTAGDGRPYVQIVKFRQNTTFEKAQHPLPPGAPDERGQECLGLDDPPPRRKENKVKGRESPPAPQFVADTETQESWIERLVREYPQADIRSQLALAMTNRRLGGKQLERGWFEQQWLTKLSPTVQLDSPAPASAPAAAVPAEPNNWRQMLKATHPGESWALSAQACTWQTLPSSYRARIFAAA